jgi:hypothetical protein
MDPEKLHRRKYRKGDGSKDSHKYDYLVDELHELRETLIETEQTLGHDSEEGRTLQSQIRLKERIRRNAKMLDNGMPQEEFDQLVQALTRQMELRLEDKPEDKPGNDMGGGEDPFDEMRTDHHEARRARSKEMQELGRTIRELKDHWRTVGKPLTHNATPELSKEMNDVYEAIQQTTDKAERKALRDELAHLQTLVHDIRRHKDMNDEDKSKVTELRAQQREAQSEEEKMEIREEIEALYRAHRKEKRQSKAEGEGRTEEREHTPFKNFREDDDELKGLHDELHQAEDKATRKEIRKKIRQRLQLLRSNERDAPPPHEREHGQRRMRGRSDSVGDNSE